MGTVRGSSNRRRATQATREEFFDLSAGDTGAIWDNHQATGEDPWRRDEDGRGGTLPMIGGVHGALCSR